MILKGIKLDILKLLISFDNSPDLEDYVMDNYERSPRMSTYLVAMMVSDFVKIRSDPSSSPDIDFNVLVRPGLEDQTK